MRASAGEQVRESKCGTLKTAQARHIDKQKCSEHSIGTERERERDSLHVVMMEGGRKRQLKF